MRLQRRCHGGFDVNPRWTRARRGSLYKATGKSVGRGSRQPFSRQPLMISPPFGCSTCPVMYDASCDARNT